MQKSLTEIFEEKGNVMSCHMRKAAWRREKKKRKSPSEPTTRGQGVTGGRGEKYVWSEVYTS